MDYTILKARAKINIALDVLGKREDGYHDLRMIMQSVNLYDTIFIKKIQRNDIVLKTNLIWMPCDNRNLVYRAISAMKERYDIKTGVFAEITKQIPVSAGLAGGSADCAAALVGMRNLFNIDASNYKLMEIGAKIGADVPYCVMRGSVLAEGIGEKLTKLSPFPRCYILLAKPPINVSTPSVFKAIDSVDIKKHPNIDKMIIDIKNSNLKEICSGMHNVLENVTMKNYPIIEQLKNTMVKFNATGAMMSGSGPTVFGIFQKKYNAVEALKYIHRQYKIRECYLTTIFNI